MPASDRSNGRGRADEPDEGMLSKLPRTRPQRATRRRLAAREAVTGTATAQAAAPSGNGVARVSDTATAAPRASTLARAGTRARNGARTKASTGARAKAPTGARAKAPSGARAKGSTGARAKGSTGARAKSAGAQRKQQRRPGSARRANAALQPAPRQGFASESERPVGPVQPPGGAELLAGAAEIIGEVTKAGLSAGERLFRDMLSRLPLS